MMNRNEGLIRIQGSTLVRAALAALAIATLASAPHAEAQRRPSATARAASVEVAEAAPSDGQGVVNIQTASLEELARLPGIGPAKAAAIVAQRERSAFRRVEDILRVRGIGRATFRRLRPMLTVSGPTTLVEATRPSRSSRAAADAEEGAEEASSGR